MNDFKDNTRNDDISQLFRQNAERLEERPPNQAWDRLERKLETRRLRTRTIVYRYTSLAAAVIGVFALIMAVQLVNRATSFAEKTEMAVNEADDSEQPLDQPLTDDEKKIAEFIQIQKKQQALEREGYIEGDAEIPKVEKGKPSVKQPSVNAKKDRKDEFRPMPSDGVPDKKSINKPSSPKIADAKSKVVAPSKKKNESYAPPIAENVTDEYIIEEEAEEEVDMVVDDDLAEAPEKSKDKLEKDLKPKPEPAIVSRDKIVAKEENTYRKNQSGQITNSSVDGGESLDEIKVDNSSNSTKRKESKKSKSYSSAMTQFSWMVGKWADSDATASYENWYLDLQNGLLGEGYVLENGEKKFVEYMKIYEKKGKIYFESSIDDSKKHKTFKLKSNKNGQAIFERKSRKFPNQVIIQKIGNDAFTIIYKNKKTTSINQSQSKYFQKRNTISSERVARKLKRH